MVEIFKTQSLEKNKQIQDFSQIAWIYPPVLGYHRIPH